MNTIKDFSPRQPMLTPARMVYRDIAIQAIVGRPGLALLNPTGDQTVVRAAIAEMHFARKPEEQPTDACEKLIGFIEHLKNSLRNYKNAAKKSYEEDSEPKNPIWNFATRLLRDIENGNLPLPAIEQIVRILAVKAIATNAIEKQDYIGHEPDIDISAKLEELFTKFAYDGGGIDGETTMPVSFEAFQETLSREFFGIVFTAHPTFSVSERIATLQSRLISGAHADGTPLTDHDVGEIISQLMQSELRPDAPLTLSREHEISLRVVRNVQDAAHETYKAALRVARRMYPEQWQELRPRLFDVASWLWRDNDGRTDVKPMKAFAAFVQEKALAFGRWEEILHKNGAAEKPHLLAIARKFATERTNLTAEAEAIGNDDTNEAIRFEKIAEAEGSLWNQRAKRFMDSTAVSQLLTAALAEETDADTQLTLLALRAEVEHFGVIAAKTHFRTNADNIQNAINDTLEGMGDSRRLGEPGDPKDTPIINQLLNQCVTQPDLHFGKILGLIRDTDGKNKMSAPKQAPLLFMLARQMHDLLDRKTPIRYLIAECEHPNTILAALYFAKAYGVEDIIDISPLFETEKGIGKGANILRKLLENEHYRAYVQKRGRLCVQIGFSDSGRFLGQAAAGSEIGELHKEIRQILDEVGLHGVIFDTGGESIGRGTHPHSLVESARYHADPSTRAPGRIKLERSAQGIDGFTLYLSHQTTHTTLYRLLQEFSEKPAPEDPMYSTKYAHYIAGFFGAVKRFQREMTLNPDTAQLLSLFGSNLNGGATGSRSAARAKADGKGDTGWKKVEDLRAIPQNAIYQQLGMYINVLGGIGEAIGQDPEQFNELMRISPRFRRIMQLVTRAWNLSDPHVMRAYINVLDPTEPLDRAQPAIADRGDDHARGLAKLSDLLDGEKNFGRLRAIYRRVVADHIKASTTLRDISAEERKSTDPENRKRLKNRQTELQIAHVIRVALMRRATNIASTIRKFSSGPADYETVMRQLRHFDIPTAVANLRETFGGTANGQAHADYPARKPGTLPTTANYASIERDVIAPLEQLHKIMCDITVTIDQLNGCMG